MPHADHQARTDARAPRPGAAARNDAAPVPGRSVGGAAASHASTGGVIQCKQLYIPMRPDPNTPPDQEMQWQRGEMIETDNYTVRQLLDILAQLKPEFHRGNYQALKLEIAERWLRDATQRGNQTEIGHAQQFLQEVQQERSQLLPVTNGEQGMTPQPSSRGQLGAFTNNTMTMFGQSELNRDNTRRHLIRQNNETWLLDDGTVPTGSYAYVTHMSQQIVVWPCNDNGSNTFHGGLSYFAPEVGYAGTVRFQQGRVVSWSADSGTYKPKVEQRGQSGLPGNKFVPGQGY